MKTTPLLALAVIAAFAGIPASSPAQEAKSMSAPSGPLPTGITSVQLQAGNARPISANSVLYTNVRVKSSTTTLNDYLAILYKTSDNSLTLTPESADVYPGVGVYYEDGGIVFKDIASLGTIKQGKTNLTWGTSSNLTFGPPVIVNLQTGSVIAIAFGTATAPYSVRIKELATGNIIAQDNGITTTSYIYGIPFLRAGKYSIDLIPQTGKSVSVSMRFNHDNTANLVTLASGDSFSFSLGAYSLAYGKIKVHLAAGKSLKVTLGTSSSVDLSLVSSASELVGEINGMRAGQTYTFDPADATGDYYLALRKVNTATTFDASASTSGTIEIVP